MPSRFCPESAKLTLISQDYIEPTACAALAGTRGSVRADERLSTDAAVCYSSSLIGLGAYRAYLKNSGAARLRKNALILIANEQFPFTCGERRFERFIMIDPCAHG